MLTSKQEAAVHQCIAQIVKFDPTFFWADVVRAARVNAGIRDKRGVRKVFENYISSGRVRRTSNAQEEYVAVTAKSTVKTKKIVFTREQMAQAFDMVKDKSDWKNPIHAVVADPGEMNLRCVAEAIPYFTGSAAHIWKDPKGRMHISAPGYYLSMLS